ncbi:hypothetical protein ADM96_32675 [Burkholderia sp. ST111]|nr:hypothetical protein ADM96_32675 [Burkholderia sp. ST111]
MTTSQVRLIDILQRGSNGFDVIRLFAAVAVIFGHSFYLFPTGGFHEPVTMLVQNNFSGTLAVGVFFFISGILITHSFERNPSVPRYVTMRLARIYPGVLVCLLVTVFVIGPSVTTLTAHRYLFSPATHCFIRDNWSVTSLFWFWGGPCMHLPGVFSSNPLPDAVNGSLWTLFPELVCYAYVLVFGLLGVLKSNLRIFLAVFGLLVLHSVSPKLTPYFSDDHYTDYLKVGMFFLAGVVAFASRKVLVIHWVYLVPLVIFASFTQHTPVAEYALYIALFYLVLVCAASPVSKRIMLPGDYSFGTYIYGFVIQQSVAHTFPSLTSYSSNLLCIPIAVGAGVASWHLVERPMLSFGRKLTSRFARRRGQTPACDLT